jgi:hypothetical protein
VDLDNNSELAKNILVKHMGNTQFAGVSFYPGYTRHNFTIGVFGSSQIRAQPANPILPELNVDAKADYGLVVGLAGAFLDEKLQVGLAGRYQARYSFDRSYTFHDLATNVIRDEFEDPDLSIADSGHGFLADVGVIYNFYKNGFNPRIGAAVNNMGANSFGPAEDLPYSIALSFGISPNYGVFKSDIILDVIDVTHNFEQDDDWLKRVNIGAEVNFDVFLLRRLAFRAGLHQSYFTYGFGFDFTVVRFNYAYYKEEVGAYAGQDGDTRHAAEFVFGF